MSQSDELPRIILPACMLPVYILAGGRSSRFPGDKARVLVGGVPQLQRLVQQFNLNRYGLTVVADRCDRYLDLGIHCEVDIYADCGPVGGLLTGLELRLRRHGAGWLVVIGCDQLLWRTEWLNEIAAKLCAMQSGSTNPEKSLFTVALWASPDADSKAPSNPIPGLYHTDLLPCLQDSCRQGKLSLRDLIQTQGQQVYYHFQEEQPRDYSFNSPEQLDSLLKRLRLPKEAGDQATSF